MLRIMCSSLPIADNVRDDTAGEVTGAMGEVGGTVDEVGGTVGVVGGTAGVVVGTVDVVGGTAGVVAGPADEEVQSLSPILPEPETVCKVCII